ncbi:MAG TPA: alpha/beta hydrolase, partial [Chryseolinea sp.]
MKIYLILLLTLCSALGYAQKIEKGNLNGATFTIAIPENWKGKLVMYAHGYEFVGSPKQSENPRFTEGMKTFLDRGFAVAASDYSLQGFALPQGVDETEAL